MRRFLKTYNFCTQNPLSSHVISSRIGGSSADQIYEQLAGKYENSVLKKVKYSIPGATIITNPDECKKCLEVLYKTTSIVAWDTETCDLDIKNETPVGNGRIVCASFFAGPEFNFGNGSKVFIDNFGKNAGLLNYFKDYLEN